MPIIRTPIIDDSGSGQDGTVIDNAWKQELYNQIDAAIAASISAIPEYRVGGFTLTDGSGAGLVFSTGGGTYVKFGQIVVVTMQVIWPANSNGLPAKLAGLPFPPTASVSLYEGFGATHIRTWTAGNSTLEVFGAGSGGAMTNALMSGVNVTLHGAYVSL
jgi:hypothetical protein